MNQVVVLLSTYNGEKYLHEQIESLLKQKNVDIKIIVRDDGSTDNTVRMLDEYAKKGVLEWYSGENLGSAKSFLDLVKRAPDSDYYAFCDQDDVWNEDKLYKATQAIENKRNGLNKDLAILYCSNYQLVDAKLNHLPDNNHISTITFNSSLVSSCCTGCTVVFNKELKKFLSKAIPQNIVMHDDWAHKVCLAVGGVVVYDPEKTLMYRQHGNNADGGIHTTKDKIKGVISRIRSKERIRSKQISEIGKIFGDCISKDKLLLIEKFDGYYRNPQKWLFLLLSPSMCTPYKRLNRGFKLAVFWRYF